jgi:hypothetical protein
MHGKDPPEFSAKTLCMRRLLIVLLGCTTLTCLLWLVRESDSPEALVSVMSSLCALVASVEAGRTSNDR